MACLEQLDHRRAAAATDRLDMCTAEMTPPHSDLTGNQLDSRDKLAGPKLFVYVVERVKCYYRGRQNCGPQVW